MKDTKYSISSSIYFTYREAKQISYLTYLTGESKSQLIRRLIEAEFQKIEKEYEEKKLTNLKKDEQMAELKKQSYFYIKKES